MTDNNRFGLELALGKQQAYQDHYNPELLQPIARDICRQHLPIQSFNGVDVWTGYELSWLAPSGKPRVAIAEFTFSAASSHIVESKSFKYYLNSFNQTRISEQELMQKLQQDLTQASGGEVTIIITTLDDYRHPETRLKGFTCVDDLELASPQYNPKPELLVPEKNASGKASSRQRLYSHLLKSNCPVTGQPDWASLWVEFEGPVLAEECFLAYVISYRGHQDFHENCVEQIYCDLWTALSPASLSVYARYTRRGGLDINPFRCSHNQSLPAVKAARQ